MALGCFLTGFWEELALRGVFLCNAADGLRAWLTPDSAVAGAVALNSIVFGVAHLGQVTVPALVATWVLSGLVLSVLHVPSGDLALVIGAHAAYNLSHQVLFVRSEIPGPEELSVLVRVSTHPADLWLSHGGLIEASGFLLLGVLGVLWLRVSRGSLALRVHPVPPAHVVTRSTSRRGVTTIDWRLDTWEPRSGASTATTT